MLLLSASLLPASESFRLFPPTVPPARYFEPEGDGGFRPFHPLSLSREDQPDEFLLDVGSPWRRGFADGSILLDPAVRKPSRTWPWVVTGGVVVGSTVSVVSAGHERHDFHFANEGWMGRDSYAGGADKASHFVMYNALTRELGVTYQQMGYERDRALLMGFGTAMTAGLITEIGDGLTVFGFAWQDLLVDALGAGTAVLIMRNGLDDTIGFRFGKVTADQPPPCCRTPGLGKDYSLEIYTADLKISGLARRLKLRPGPARFLLLSMTYGSKGYRYSLPELRQRNLGIELGVNFPEILSAVGVPERKWWGRALYFLFNFFRFPYTSVGFHYDLNHGKWNGPDAGNVYDPGP